MAIVEDPRLCKAYLGCKSYMSSAKAGNTICSGCAGDFSSHSVISRTIDKHLAPVIASVLTTDGNEVARQFVQAAGEIRQDFAENAGMDVAGAEVGLLIGLRLMQRVSTLETQAAISR